MNRAVLESLKDGVCPLCNKVVGSHGLYNHFKEYHSPDELLDLLHELAMEMKNEDS